MKLTIEINEEELQEAVIAIIARNVAQTNWKYMTREALKDAVKEVVYADKENLMERCVERASTELTKKGLPRLLDKMMEKD